jgi:ATP-binding cassette subfamily C protein CydCD
VLTGSSGAGKSTALAAIMRHLDPSGGRILFGHTDIRTLDSEAARARIAWCGAGTHLFDSTLRENLLLARAVLADRPVLLLDEPTARLASDLHTVIQDRAAVIVTHRPADFPDLPTVTLAASSGAAAPQIRVPDPMDADRARSPAEPGPKPLLRRDQWS